jgi:DNA-directed RNA polymerase beta' subunit
MGSIDRQFKCTSCGETAPECIGHFGHIELQTPVFHPGITSTQCPADADSLGFMRKIQKLLECVCHNCGKILSDEVRPCGFAVLANRDRATLPSSTRFDTAIRRNALKPSIGFANQS